MSVLVVGSVAYDSVETPHGKHDHLLGGSATYFSLSASNFAPVRLVAVVGEDFKAESREVLSNGRIDLEGLKTISGKTFHWSGAYEGDMNEAITRDTQLNVLADFKPELPESYKKTENVFLANIDPELQLEVLEQVENPRFKALDTMNFWIESKKDALVEVVKRVDLMVINDGEARLLTGEVSLVAAAKAIHRQGPTYVIIKRGEYGALMYSEKGFFWAPAYPLETVQDPTGAGDTFAGGVMGYLSSQPEITDNAVRRACYYGSVMAAFTVEDFSVQGLLKAKRELIDRRYQSFLDLVRLEA